MEQIGCALECFLFSGEAVRSKSFKMALFL